MTDAEYVRLMAEIAVLKLAVRQARETGFLAGAEYVKGEAYVDEPNVAKSEAFIEWLSDEVLTAAAREYAGRCPRTWRSGILSPPGAPYDGEKCNNTDQHPGLCSFLEAALKRGWRPDGTTRDRMIDAGWRP